MIRTLVDFALNNKFVVLAVTVLLIGWGAIAFHNLPVEAYPDIADNYVTVITQWPGRSAEEVEQQVTFPIEMQMGGMPHMTYLRSESIFGLSFVIMIFRRHFRQRLEPPESNGKAHTGQSSAWTKPATSNRHRLEHHGPDLLVHAEKYKSKETHYPVSCSLGATRRLSAPSPRSLWMEDCTLARSRFSPSISDVATASVLIASTVSWLRSSSPKCLTVPCRTPPSTRNCCSANASRALSQVNSGQSDSCQFHAMSD